MASFDSLYRECGRGFGLGYSNNVEWIVFRHCSAAPVKVRDGELQLYVKI